MTKKLSERFDFGEFDVDIDTRCNAAIGVDRSRLCNEIESLERQRDALLEALRVISTVVIRPPLTTEQAQQMMRLSDIARAAIKSVEEGK